MLTKTQEVDHVTRFVADLPRGSYLADLLADLPTECAALIRSDLSWPLTVRQNLEARQRADAELADLREEERKLRRDLETLRGQVSRAQDALAEIRSTAKELARMV